MGWPSCGICPFAIPNKSCVLFPVVWHHPLGWPFPPNSRSFPALLHIRTDTGKFGFFAGLCWAHHSIPVQSFGEVSLCVETLQDEEPGPTH